MNERKYYLDWIKSLAILLLVLAHAARVFDYLPFYVKSGNHLWAEILIRFLDSWFMPLFFVIGGMAACYSIEKRGAAKFRSERAKRLLVPLGFALISTLPILGYIAYRFSNPESSDGFWTYLPRFYTFDASQLQGYTGTFSVAHLWYLLYLYIFSMLSGPIFRRLNEGRIPAWAKRMPLFFAAICVTLGKLTLLPYPNPIYFLAFFWLGYAIAAERNDFDVFRQLRDRPALVWTAAIVLMSVLWAARIYYLPGFGPFAVYLALQPVYTVNALLWVLLVLFYGAKYFTRPHPVLNYLSEASLYVYIVHMSIAMFVAWLLSDRFSSGISFAIITVATYAATFLFYEALVRRWNPLRFVFGLGPKKS
ncbi:MAG: acyltransferase family protein [bacterium]|nr:acyltransferase family protein [bacterium]